MNRIFRAKEITPPPSGTPLKKGRGIFKIIVLLLIIIIFFSFSNYKYFLGNYYNNKGNISYNNGIFTGALINHDKAYSYVENENFLHNIGNDFFKYGETKENIQEKKDNYYKSLGAYSGSLNIKFDEKTKENYDIVLEKLKQLEEQEKQEEQEEKKQKEEQQKNEENSENTQEDEEGKKEDENEEQKDGGKTEDTEEKNEDETGDIENNQESSPERKLSKQELKQIEKYVEGLKEEEIRNQKYFNKKSEEQTNPNDFFKDFFKNDTLFDDMIDRGGEKDW